MVEADLSRSSHYSEVNKDMVKDFDEIMNANEEEEGSDADPKIKRPLVQESNVIAVERASQIRKPN